MKGVNGWIITVLIKLKHLKKKIHCLHLSDEKASAAVRRSTFASKQLIKHPRHRLKLCGRSRNPNSKQSSDWLADVDDTAGRLVCTGGRLLWRGRGFVEAVKRITRGQRRGGYCSSLRKCAGRVAHRTLTLVINNRKLVWTVAHSLFARGNNMHIWAVGRLTACLAREAPCWSTSMVFFVQPAMTERCSSGKISSQEDAAETQNSSYL